MARLGCFGFFACIVLIFGVLTELGIGQDAALIAAFVLMLIVIPFAYAFLQGITGNVCPHCGHERKLVLSRYPVCQRCGGDMTAEHP